MCLTAQRGKWEVQAMRFDGSNELHQRASQTAPGGIHSNVRAVWQPHPMFYERGEGAHVWDVDGNPFIDYVLARGPLLLGHSPKPVLDAVKSQLDRGLMYAGQHAMEVEAAERFCRLVPCADMVRFASSGSETVHAALRLARAVTGRMKVLRFEGHYHGWFDNIAWNYAPSPDKAGPREDPHLMPASQGQVLSDAENLIIRPWNDLELVRAVFEKYRGQIAAVIGEPVMCNTGAILPRPGYLEGLRELCTRYGALLIMDEVITGFRAALGGAQEYFGVTPDLATFAKGMSAGFPVAALAGRREYMQAFGDMSVTHAGTYNSNAPGMAATVAALDTLAADGGAALRHAQAMGTRLMSGIRESGEKAGKRITVRGLPAVFHVSFNETDEVVDYRTFLSRDPNAYGRFWAGLQERGIRTIPGGLWFVSTAHTPEDIDRTLSAVHEAMRAV
ncbi:MAG: glutamate-1-semialdehyde 2,1-aminomutase [Phycisphaerae bacterium]